MAKKTKHSYTIEKPFLNPFHTVCRLRVNLNCIYICIKVISNEIMLSIITMYFQKLSFRKFPNFELRLFNCTHRTWYQLIYLFVLVKLSIKFEAIREKVSFRYLSESGTRSERKKYGSIWWKTYTRKFTLFYFKHSFTMFSLLGISKLFNWLLCNTLCNQTFSYIVIII